MGFIVRYRQRARRELDAFDARFGSMFGEAVRAWLQELAVEAERNEQVSSVDALPFLRDLLGPDDAEQAFPTGFHRWRSAHILEKIHVLLILLAQRRPPWEFRMAMNVFLGPNPNGDGMPPDSPVVVTAVYEVDRPNSRIVVTMFPEPKLPDA
jgi:hypothetical protein